ncbi:MAG TPA: ATP-binding protein [Gaiellaceae bacterium]|nr:ATP-binding protein [Gaiellaceae bacterium]
MNVDAARGRALIEESPELVLVLDSEGRVVAASRRARESLADVELGEPVPDELLKRSNTLVPVDVEGRAERLLYLGQPGELAAYEELRAGFTAAVSHELRTPLARLLALLESADLPGADPLELIRQAHGEVEQVRELIDDVLFLSELETGKEVVSLGTTRALPVLEEVRDKLAERAERADVTIVVAGDAEVELPLRPRMLRTVVENLAENALRYAGPRSTLRLSVGRDDGATVLRAADDGAGVTYGDLPRLFERFYRADRARASRGTGLGLAIVKHIVTSGGGAVEARVGEAGGLEIRAVFPA